MRVYLDGTNDVITGQTIAAGTPLRIEVDLLNPSFTGAQTRQVQSRLLLDRNQAAGYDLDDLSASTSLTPGQGTTVQFFYTPTEAGDYFAAPATLSQVDGIYEVTNGNTWGASPVFSVSIPHMVILEELIINGVDTFDPSISLPNMLLLDDQVELIGKVVDENQLPVPYAYVGITDAVGLLSSEIRTNELGNFSYQTTVLSDGTTLGPRSLLLVTDQQETFTLLHFFIGVPSAQILTTNEYLAAQLPNLNASYSFEIEDISITNENQEYIWTTPQNEFTTFSEIQTINDVTRDNYHFVLRQYHMTVTNPFHNQPEILDRALQIQSEIASEAQDAYFDELKNTVGPGRLLVYVGGLGTCLLGSHLVIGAAGCVIVKKMLVEDAIKLTGVTLLHAADAPPELIDGYRNGLDFTFTIIDYADGGIDEAIGSLALLTVETSIEEELLRIHQEIPLDAMEAGNSTGQVLLSSQNKGEVNNPFTNATYTQEGNTITFEFNFSGQRYRAMTNYEPASVFVEVKLFLQGAYTGAGVMSTGLNAELSTTQPYNTAPWNYGGPEHVTSIPPDAVDWVLMELRTGTAANTAVATQAALLMKDGTVSATFPDVAPGDYYIVIRHRNHLDIMTATPVSLTAASASAKTMMLDYDFTTAPSRAYGGVLKDLGDGTYGLYGGDANADNKLVYIGEDRDQKEILELLGLTNAAGNVAGYLMADMNMDGSVFYIGENRDQRVLLDALGLTTVATVILSNVPD